LNRVRLAFAVGAGVRDLQGWDGTTPSPPWAQDKSIGPAVETTAREADRPSPVRITGLGYVGQDGEPARKRVPILPAKLPWHALRRHIRARTWSNTPGGGPQRTTRAANADKRDERLLLEAQLRERADGERVTIEDLAAERRGTIEETAAAEKRGAFFEELRRAAARAATPGQRKILELLAEGNTQSETARILGIARQTVSEQLRRLKSWLGGEL
jgi:DNA-directed RNA polymerase specialized sigma24 family protein